MIKLKRVYDIPEESDGFRILVDRLWPRGVSKAKGKIDEWVKEVAEVKYYYPTLNNREWDRQFSRYQKIMNMKK